MSSKRYEDWSDDEVQSVVESYLRMLRWEMSGQPYVKAHANTAVRARLNGRTKGSVEFKYQNISAVLVRIRRQPIRGYKPAANSQAALASAISEALLLNPELDEEMRREFNPADWTWFSI
jgi:5-methylcytosine-specific restriction protein A